MIGREVTKSMPRPLCSKCRKPVERFQVTHEAHWGMVKFEAECCGGYELVRLSAEECGTGVQLAEAFAGAQ